MNHQDNLDRLRSASLEKIERAQRGQKALAIVAAVFEAAGLLAFLLLMDFSNRTHVLLLLAAVLIYGTILLWLLSLGSYLKQSILRILQAIETLDRAD